VTIDEAKGLAKFALDFAIKQLRETKSFQAICHLIPAEGSIEVVLIDGDDLNSFEAKYEIGKKLKARAKEINAVATVFITDAYMAEITDMERYQQACQIAGHHIGDTATLERLGLAKRRECLMVSVETPIFRQFGMQFYARTKNGKPFFLEYVERDASDGAEMRGQGNFFGFFEDAPAAKGAAQ
jgi:hypothetical protein